MVKKYVNIVKTKEKQNLKIKHANKSKNKSACKTF